MCMGAHERMPCNQANMVKIVNLVTLLGDPSYVVIDASEMGKKLISVKNFRTW